MTQSFDEYWNEWCIASNCEEGECRNHFEAGAQSRQAEIDSLHKNIDALHVENERIQKEYQMMFYGVQGRQNTIDELQKRIDGALIKLNDARNNGVDKSHYEAIKILKGNKDEHN